MIMHLLIWMALHDTNNNTGNICMLFFCRRFHHSTEMFMQDGISIHMDI